MSDTYRVIYKGFNGDFNLTEEDMDLEAAKKFKEKCLNMGYKIVYIIQIVE